LSPSHLTARAATFCLGDAAYYSIAELQAAFAGLLTDVGSFSWRSADLFWGRKPG
jgi:hypothetical protein